MSNRRNRRTGDRRHSQDLAVVPAGSSRVNDATRSCPERDGDGTGRYECVKKVDRSGSASVSSTDFDTLLDSVTSMLSGLSISTVHEQCRMRSRMNALVPINRLPVEILECIFMKASELLWFWWAFSTRNDSGSACFAISHTCALWRCISLRLPCMWRFMYISLTHNSQPSLGWELLKRSKDTPLWVRCRFGYIAKSPDHALLSSALSRADSIGLLIDDPRAASVCLPASRAKHLALQSMAPADITLSGHLPKLRHLCLVRCSLATPPNICRRLQELFIRPISTSAGQQTLPNLILVLRAMPELTTLMVTGRPCLPATTDAIPRSKAHLPRLSYLLLSLPPRGIDFILKHVAIPETAHMRLRPKPFDDHSPFFLSYYPRARVLEDCTELCIGSTAHALTIFFYKGDQDDTYCPSSRCGTTHTPCMRIGLYFSKSVNAAAIDKAFIVPFFELYHLRISKVHIHGITDEQAATSAWIVRILQHLSPSLEDLTVPCRGEVCLAMRKASTADADDDFLPNVEILRVDVGNFSEDLLHFLRAWTFSKQLKVLDVSRCEARSVDTHERSLKEMCPNAVIVRPGMTCPHVIKQTTRKGKRKKVYPQTLSRIRK